MDAKLVCLFVCLSVCLFVCLTESGVYSQLPQRIAA
jgi:hypothetical protein